MKYIVEFEDEPCMYEDEVHFYKCIQAPWWGLSEKVIKQLTPYQPDHVADISKKADWIPCSGWWSRIHKCSQCGNVLDFDGVNAGRGDANFCPSCGADMRGTEDG